MGIKTKKKFQHSNCSMRCLELIKDLWQLKVSG